MMSCARPRFVLALVLVSSWASSGRAATLELAAPAPAPSKGIKTSSAWLRTGEAHQQKGENAQAGEAYRKALETLSQQKQGANEGARAAMLSADAHWLAFEQDLDVLHLQAALDVLSLWLTLTGPQSRASLLVDVQRTFARIRAVRDPLADADAALVAGDAPKAAGLHGDAVDALANQGYEWSLGARIVLRGSAGIVGVYDGHVKSPADVGPHLHELRAARDLLAKWKEERPADDASEQGPAVDRALADVEARIAEAEQAVADEARAEQARQRQREADEAKRLEAERAAADAAAAEREAKAAEARKQRTLAIALVSGGAVAVGAGAGLLGEGAYYRSAFAKDADARAAEARELEAELGAGYDLEGFDADLRARREQNDRRNLGMIIGGSVLAAGGLAASIVGIVELAQGRRGRGSTQRARVRPGPLLVTVEF